MSYNIARTEQVRKLLEHIPEVRERKMFGSIGFIVRDKLCLGVGDHADHCMLVRVGPDAYEEALARAGAVPAIMRGREQRGYVFLTEEALETEADLRYWVDLALRYNESIA